MSSVTRTAVEIPEMRPLLKDFGTCLSFNGSTSTVKYGTTNPFTGSYYVSMWVKWNGLNGNFQTLVAKRDSYAANGLMFSVALNSTTGTINLDTVTSFVPWAITIKQRRWTHICWVHDTSGGNDLLYIDGVIASTQGIATLGTKTDALISVGACEATPTDVFNGLIDEVVIGQSAPSATDVLAIAKKYIYPSQWTYSKYNEGSGTSATDSSGNGNTGTITAATYTTDKVMTARSSVTNRFVLLPSETCLALAGDTTVKLPVNPSTTFSMMFWYRPRETGNAQLINWQENFNTKGFFVQVNNIAVTFTDFVSTTPQTSVSGTIRSVWQHILFQISPGFCNLYINGVLASTQFPPAFTLPSGQQLTIGGYSFFGSGDAKGKIKDFILKDGVSWNASNALAHMYTRTIPPTPTVYYKLNGNATDSSGNANNGTLTLGTGTWDTCDAPNYGQRTAV